MAAAIYESAVFFFSESRKASWELNNILAFLFMQSMSSSAPSNNFPDRVESLLSELIQSPDYNRLEGYAML